MTKIFVTKEWLKKLQDELTNLKDFQRVEIAAKLKEAISFWDLSENSEYEDARNEQAAVELRISDLEEQLKNVEIIKEKATKWEKVIMWGTVVLENIATKVKESYKIVGSTESDIMAEVPMISNDSPVGKAVLWKKIKTNVIVKAPSGNFEYKILEIK
jgi:transcription elongation factor GreA